MHKKIHSVAGTGYLGYEGDGGLAVDSMLNSPFHVELDPSEKFLYIADCFNFVIRKVDLKTGIISTIAGTGRSGYTGDGDLAINADIDEIYAIQVDHKGNLYMLQRLIPCIRKIDLNTGVIQTIAGTGISGYSGDNGLAVQATMKEPNDCVLDGHGGLLVADVQDQRIRKIDLNSGLITTFAGTGEKAHSGDDQDARYAALHGARAVCVDTIGNTYLCEREGNTLRKIDADGIISTVAGTGEKGYEGDGGPATAATLNGPKAIRCDPDGNVFIVDTENHAIRKLDVSSGILTTVSGGHEGPDGDGGQAILSGMGRPHGVVIDKSGGHYVADTQNHRVRYIG